MCGRFTVLTREELADAVAAVEARRAPAPLAPNDDRVFAFPQSLVPIIDANLNVDERTWGFGVEWQKGPVFNTRIESLLEGRGMWRALAGDAQGARCLVPAARFFEPHATETERNPRTGRQAKRAYTFEDPEGAPLLLAGVQSDGCCSVVTTVPNGWVSPVHARMPLVLRFDEAPLWLESGGLWRTLADRSAFALAVAPEHRPAYGDALTGNGADAADADAASADGSVSSQLSLF